MSVDPLRRAATARLHPWCWALSMLLHTAVAGGAVALLSDLRLAPEPEPFKWEVSFAAPPAMEQAQEAGVSAEATLATTAPRGLRTESGSTESPPPLQAAQPIKDAAPQPPQEIQQRALAARPVEPSPVEPSEEPHQPVEAMEPLPVPPPMETAASPHNQTAEGELIASASRQTVAAFPSSVSPETPAASSTTAESSTIDRAVPEPTPLKEATPSPSATVPTEQVTAVEGAVPSASDKKVDYGWLTDTLWSQVEKLKRYPTLARINRLEGRVVLRVVISADGHLEELAIAQSSGHAVLDQAALETLREASPLTLKYPLAKPQIVVQVPINYRLDR